MKRLRENKKAVSLIVLVITVIVMIILAGAIVLTLNNTGIIERSESAVEAANMQEIQTLASLKWAEAFIDGKTTQEEIEEYVIDGLKNEKIDISDYRIKVSTEGVNVVKRTTSTGEWVAQTVNGVPIPKGFVASSATGENTIKNGLVIYEGSAAVTNENVETARKTRNQYVWVPVENFEKDFIRRKISSTEPTKSNKLGDIDKIWEVVLDENNMPKAFQDSNYVTATTLAEVQEMYESVKAYGGFYIARYEAGIDAQRKLDNGVLENKVYFVMGKIPYTYIGWTKNNRLDQDLSGAVQVARSIYPSDSNLGVVSTLAYGVQWDTTLQWWLDSGAVSSLTDGTSYGNHNDHVITSKDDLNDGAMVFDFTSNPEGDYVAKDSTTLTYPKQSGTYWALTTGALKKAKVNNIYDMSGNMWEWTMEGFSNIKRCYRGGSFHSSGTTVSYPVKIASDLNFGSERKGFRIALYIKK